MAKKPTTVEHTRPAASSLNCVFDSPAGPSLEQSGPEERRRSEKKCEPRGGIPVEAAEQRGCHRGAGAETPGTRAQAWANPTTTASITPTSPIVR